MKLGGILQGREYRSVVYFLLPVFLQHIGKR